MGIEWLFYHYFRLVNVQQKFEYKTNNNAMSVSPSKHVSKNVVHIFCSHPSCALQKFMCVFKEFPAKKRFWSGYLNKVSATFRDNHNDSYCEMINNDMVDLN